MLICSTILLSYRDHSLTLLAASSPMPIINEPSPVPEQTEVHPSKRLKTARQAWESEETTDEDILDQFLKVKQFASNRISSYESE